MSDRASVYYNNKKAGILLKTDMGYEFIYDKDYIADKEAKPISFTQKNFFHSLRTFCLKASYWSLLLQN